MPGLIEQGKLDNDSVLLKQWDSGFANIIAALAHMREGKHSAEKIVVAIQ